MAKKRKTTKKPNKRAREALQHAAAECWPEAQALGVVGLCKGATVSSRFAASWDELNCPDCLRVIADARGVLADDVDAAQKELAALKSEFERHRSGSDHDASQLRAARKDRDAAELQASELRDRIAELERERDLLKENAYRAAHGEDPVLQPIADQPLSERLAAAEKERDALSTRFKESGAALRMAYRESGELRLTLDAVARALSGQDPGPLDGAFPIAVDVAKLRVRVKELEGALKWTERERDATRDECDDAVRNLADTARALGCSPSVARMQVPAVARARLNALEQSLKSMLWILDLPHVAQAAHGFGLVGARERARSLLDPVHEGRSVAQTRPEDGASPCRDCRHSSRCKWLLGPSYKDAGPCDWSPSKFQSQPPAGEEPEQLVYARHVHGCIHCGANIPCSSEDPDACRKLVESHCQATDTSHTDPPAGE